MGLFSFAQDEKIKQTDKVMTARVHISKPICQQAHKQYYFPAHSFLSFLYYYIWFSTSISTHPDESPIVQTRPYILQPLSLWSPSPPSELYSRKDIWIKGTTRGNKGPFSALCHQVLSGFLSRETQTKGVGYFAFLPRRCSRLAVVTGLWARAASWMGHKEPGEPHVCPGEDATSCEPGYIPRGPPTKTTSQ